MSMFVAIVVGFCQPVLIVLHVESTTLHVSFRYVRLPVALYNIFTGMCSVRATLSVCPRVCECNIGRYHYKKEYTVKSLFLLKAWSKHTSDLIPLTFSDSQNKTIHRGFWCFHMVECELELRCKIWDSHGGRWWKVSPPHYRPFQLAWLDLSRSYLPSFIVAQLCSARAKS